MTSEGTAIVIRVEGVVYGFIPSGTTLVAFRRYSTGGGPAHEWSSLGQVSPLGLQSARQPGTPPTEVIEALDDAYDSMTTTTTHRTSVVTSEDLREYDRRREVPPTPRPRDGEVLSRADDELDRAT